MKTFLIWAWVLIIIGWILVWSAGRDEKIMESAEKYEQCVKAEYGVTPAYYYEEHGEYPECY